MKINLQFYNYKKNKIKQYANVDLNNNNFKIIFSNFLKLTSTLEWKSFVLYDKNLILVEGHDLFYTYKYNIEYTSSKNRWQTYKNGGWFNISKEHKKVKKYINLDYVFNNEHNIFFHDFYRRKKYRNILEHLAIVIGCELYEVFMEKESLEKPIRERTTCIPGITTSKLIYSPYENNSFRQR